MTDLQGLIERLEKAEGPDRELDNSLTLAAFPEGRIVLAPDQRYDYIMGSSGGGPVSPLTASIDAAVAFAERVLPGCWYQIAKGKLRDAEPLFGALILFGSDEVLGAGEHPTSLPIAILIATLRALQAQGGSDG